MGAASSAVEGAHVVQQRFSPREVRTSVPHGLMCTLVDAWRSRGHTSQVRFRIQEYRIMMWSRETGDVGEEGQRSAISWSNCPRRHEARKISLAASRLHEIWKTQCAEASETDDAQEHWLGPGVYAHSCRGPLLNMCCVSFEADGGCSVAQTHPAKKACWQKHISSVHFCAFFSNRSGSVLLSPCRPLYVGPIRLVRFQISVPGRSRT